mgnify:CR=1 FL=1
MSKITEKIAKLLALAESPYEEEAKAALLQARRLMAEHKLMPEDIEPRENKRVIQECVGVTCTKLSSPWTVYLSTLIAAHYCCRPYRSSVHGSKVSEIGFIGIEDDFKLCKLAFLYAYDCIASRCRQIRTQKEYPAIPTVGASAAACLPLSKSRRQNIRNGDWSWSCRRRSRTSFPK